MMVSPAAPHRHEFAKTIHATFLYTTARLHPFSMQLPAMQEGQAKPEAVLLRQQHGSWERTRRATRPHPDGGDAHRAMLPDHVRSPSQGRAARVRWPCRHHLKGGQLGYGGHVVNVAQDISTFAATLPRQKRVLPALFHLRCPSQLHHRSVRGRTRLTTVTSISCRSL